MARSLLKLTQTRGFFAAAICIDGDERWESQELSQRIGVGHA